MIFTDTILQVIAEVESMDRVQLLRVGGIGAVKADRFGADMLRIMAEHGAGDADPTGE